MTISFIVLLVAFVVYAACERIRLHRGASSDLVAYVADVFRSPSLIMFGCAAFDLLARYGAHKP